MNLENFRNYCLSLGNVTEKMPFGKFAKRYDSILVFYVCGHMFCFIDIDNFTFANIRLTPEELDELRAGYTSLSNPINCSMRYWIQLDFNGDIPDSIIYDKVQRAYNVVKSKYTKNSSQPRKYNGTGRDK